VLKLNALVTFLSLDSSMHHQFTPCTISSLHAPSVHSMHHQFTLIVIGLDSKTHSGVSVTLFVEEGIQKHKNHGGTCPFTFSSEGAHIVVCPPLLFHAQIFLLLIS